MRSILDTSGEVAAPDAVIPSHTEVIELLRVMRAAERFDRRLEALRAGGDLGLFVPALGEEAAMVGAAAALAFHDPIFAAGRGFGPLIWRGAAFSELAAAALGSADDPDHGRLGAGRSGRRDLHVHPAPGGLGNHLTQAAGAAKGLALRGEDAVSLAFFGAATLKSRGLSSALALAAAWQAPLVLVALVEIGEDCGEAAALAEARGVDGEIVDGDDVFAVQEAVAAAARRAREGGGPTLVEACCSRGTRAGLERLERFARRDGALDDAIDRAMTARIDAEIEDALRAARAAGAPASDALLGGALADDGAFARRVRETHARFGGLYGGADDPDGAFSV